jgi:membrane-bound lytic murein transglycosylase C
VQPINKRSLQYQPLAEKSAEKEKLSAAMVLAIMETESSFNPMAKSHIPAYGLMQVVPRSAGRDATAYLFGKAIILAPSYLYNSRNNVMIGSAYLNQVYYKYMRYIKDPLSRLYCTIAAYNTGPGNVAKAFSDSISIRKVAPIINGMNAEQVYEQLEKQLPYEETRNYLRKVTERMKNYSG